MVPRAAAEVLPRVVVVAAACALWWVGVLLAVPGGSPELLSDAWEYALFARHLAEGWGFRTSAIHPPLWPLHDERLTVPMLVHGPMLPCLITPFLLISRDAAVAAIPWIAALFATLTGVTLYRVASRMAGGPAGAAAVLLFTLSPLAIHAVLSDPSFAIGAFWSALAIERLAAGRAVQAGLACGAGTLVRPEFLLVAPLLALAAQGAGWRLLAGAVLPWLPWAWHQTAASGVPAFNLSSYLLIAFTPAYPDLSALRDFDLRIDRWHAVLLRELPGLWTKWLHAAPRALKHMIVAPGAATGWLAVLALLAARRGALAPLLPGARVVLVMAVPPLLMIAAQHRPDFMTTLLPLWALLAVLGALFLAGPRDASRRRWVLIALVVLAIPGAWRAVGDHAFSAAMWRDWLARERSVLMSPPGPGLSGGAHGPLIFTDAPGFLSWTTGRTAVWVTQAELERFYLEVRTGRRVLPPGFPPQIAEAATWFHDNPRAPRGHGAPRSEHSDRP